MLARLARRVRQLLGRRLVGVLYIDGFGLCSEGFLDRARALVDEEQARNAGHLDLGLLGRKLRALTGRNEGLHALIAHLAGDLRLAA